MLLRTHSEEVKILKNTLLREKVEELATQHEQLKLAHLQDMEDANARHEEGIKVQEHTVAVLHACSPFPSPLSTLQALLDRISEADDIKESLQAAHDELEVT